MTLCMVALVAVVLVGCAAVSRPDARPWSTRHDPAVDDPQTAMARTVDGLGFPDWSRYSWTPVGGRRDRLEGDREAATVLGEMRKVEAGSTLLARWSVGEPAPWLLAALGLFLAAPLLRAADRGDPFLPSAARRLGTLGALLLVGISGIVVLRWVAAEAATGGAFAASTVTPSLSLSLLHLLPGLGLLVRAGVFKRGAELRNFDRHAI